MDFNIRAISLAESVAANTRVPVGDFLGKEMIFRAGVSIAITLPHTQDQFQALPEPAWLLAALNAWTRIYRYPDAGHDVVHVLAAADGLDDEILFLRIDLKQPPPPSRRAPRVPVEIIGGAVMTYEQCAGWLVNLSSKLTANPDWLPRSVILSRPRQLRPKLIRIAWIGPEILDGVTMPFRLLAIGRVCGVEIVHIPPRAYRDIAARLQAALPLDAVIVCDHFAPYIGVDVMPDKIRREFVHFCSSKVRDELEGQVRAWAELVQNQIENERRDASADENQRLLTIMLRGMLSHSKIGQFSHCQKVTVLTGVRARHLNVATAERILEDNSENFQETKTSSALFLWKAHNDGAQYFLNPQRVEDVKVMVVGK